MHCIEFLFDSIVAVDQMHMQCRNLLLELPTDSDGVLALRRQRRCMPRGLTNLIR